MQIKYCENKMIYTLRILCKIKELSLINIIQIE